MTTYNTGNPIGSTDARDRSDNSENLDLAVNSLSPTFVDRLGVARDTLEGIYQKSAYYRAGTFDAGYTLTNNRQTLAYGNAEYSWSGAFPKVVSAGSTPATSGGVGAGAWVDRTDLTLRSQLNSHIGAGMIGDETGVTVADRFLSLPSVSPIEARFSGGADPTGVLDSTDALQACIDYCAPFEWKGSVAATKAAMGAVVAAIGGFGKFRITRPLKINPFLVIDVKHNGSFYGDNGGFQIIADFDDKDNFALDTAPFNTSGVRVLGLNSGRTDWDGGLYTGCPGWMLLGVSVRVADGRNLRGTLNRNMGIQSVVRGCSLKGANIGVQNSVCWGGSIQGNHITARAIPIFNSKDVTVDEQQGNYLTVSGTKPVSITEFKYPTWPDGTLQGKTTPVYCEYAHPNFFHNILEGGEVAVMCTNKSNLNLLDNYIEGSSYQYIYAGHTVNIKIPIRWVIAANAGLLYLRGARVTLDATAVSYLDVAGWGSIDSFSSVRLTGAKTPYIYSLPWSSQIDYADLDLNGIVDIYVSSTGSDANSGFHSSNPVLTLQEAFDRCRKGMFNRINLSGNVTTKYSYTTGGNASNKVIPLDTVEINGGGSATLTVSATSSELHSLPMGISKVRLKDIASVSIATISGDYRSLVPALGSVNLEIEGGLFSGGCLMGTKYGQVGFISLTVKGATLACALQHGTSITNTFSWIDTAVNTSVSGGTVGSLGSKKISSVLYP